MSEQTKLTLIKGGITTYEQYKRSVNRFSRAMTGKDSQRTEEEMRAAWEKLNTKIMAESENHPDEELPKA